MKKLVIALLLSLGLATQVFAEPVTIDPANLPSSYSSEALGWYRGIAQYNGCFRKSDADVHKVLRSRQVWTPKQAMEYHKDQNVQIDIIEEDGYVIFKQAGTWNILEVFSIGWESCMQGMIDYRLIVR